MNRRVVYIGNNLEGTNPTTIKGLASLLIEENIEVIVFSAKKNKLIRLLDMAFGILKYRKSDFLLLDVYSTLNFYYALIISQLARILNLKYITILHGGNLPNRLEKSPYLSKIIFKNSYKLIAPSIYLQKEFVKHNYYANYIPNFINLSKYNFTKRSNLKPKILWVRAFDKIYNPEMALRVLIGVQEKYPDAKLCMIGPDKDGSLSKIQKIAKKNNIENDIEFTGFLSKEKWVKKSEDFDIFINTSNIDNTPISVIEAMALGLSVVSTNVGGMPYLINHQHNGLLVNKNNAEEMKKEIIYLLENNNIAQNIAEHAKKTILEFDNSIVKRQWLKLLKNGS